MRMGLYELPSGKGKSDFGVSRDHAVWGIVLDTNRKNSVFADQSDDVSVGRDLAPLLLASILKVHHGARPRWDSRRKEKDRC